MAKRTTQDKTIDLARKYIKAHKLQYDEGHWLLQGISFAFDNHFDGTNEAGEKRLIQNLFYKVSEHTGVSIAQLKGNVRLEEYVTARMLLIWSMLDENIHEVKVAKALEKDRATILYWREKKKNMDFNPLMKKLYLQFKLKDND